MSTELAVRPAAALSAGEWQLAMAQAETLAMSDIIPTAYRRKPANILVAHITGRAWGWDVLTAMRNGHVIEGTWGMKPEAMLGLVRLAGHSVTAEMGDDRATVRGKRADNGDMMAWTFSFDDAVQAGLCTRYPDGRLKARSSSGKALPWEQYPKVMCYWRAVAMVCRLLFSDVTLGVHSAEELGAVTTADGDVIEAETVPPPRGPDPLSDDNMDRFRRACEAEGLDAEAVMDEAFGEGVRPEPITEEHLPEMRDAFKRLVESANAGGDSVGDPGDSAPPQEPAESPDPEGSVATVPGVRGLAATREQVGKIKGEYGRLGVEDRLLQLSHSSAILGGVSLSSHNDLTRGQAHAVIDVLAMTAEAGDLP